jgi:3D (Asp-Asp-Asp) domain-containing protein
MIPMGAYILIDYVNGEVLVGRADDTGSAIDGSHLDLCVSTHAEAIEEGVKTVDVYWKEEIEIIKD